MNLIPYAPEHLAQIDMREHEREQVDLTVYRYVFGTGEGFTATDDKGQIIAVGGWVRMWPGVFEVVVLPGKSVPRFSKSFYKASKAGIATLLKDTSVHRIQTCSLSDDQTDGYMAHLGFTYEGTLVKYTQAKQDYKMWAITR